LNGTCNFILSKMQEGAEYAPVLAEAQAKGYAEADPTEDVGGFDARAKLAILMRLALRVEVDPEEITPLPITSIAAVDFSYARDLGCTIRQIARADRAGEDRGLRGTDAGGPALAAGLVAGHGEHGGLLRPLWRGCGFLGHGAGGHPTAVAVVSDLLALAHGSRRVKVPAAPAR
jgi:homoserine dehydrogenase